MARAVGGGGVRDRGRRGRVLVLCVLAAVATSACGQVAGVHPAVRAGEGTRWETTRPVVGDAGDEPAEQGLLRYRVRVRRVRTVRVARPGTLKLCPVQGRGYFVADFGAPRYTGGYHPHAGNDMFAARGTPVVAPFDGVAVRVPNRLGGKAVKVYGREGYVYNAHLLAYGKVGRVRVGDVIGYVGNSGNAIGTPPHNHFEWHPRNGRAVDPTPFLEAACT